MVWSRVDGEGGPLVVLTHGWGATADMWDPQVDALRERARLLTWDLPGHGRSPAPDDPAAYARPTALRHLADLIEHAGGPAVLVGHSLGGQLSLELAISRPALVAGLALLSTGPGYRDPTARAAWNDQIERQAAALERRGIAALPAGDDLHGGRHGEAAAPALARAIRGLVTQHDDAIFAGLATITVPAVVIVGERDRGFVDAARYLAGKLPDAELVVVPGAGHAVNRHQPDAVNGALHRLLDRIAER